MQYFVETWGSFLILRASGFSHPQHGSICVESSQVARRQNYDLSSQPREHMWWRRETRTLIDDISSKGLSRDSCSHDPVEVSSCSAPEMIRFSAFLVVKFHLVAFRVELHHWGWGSLRANFASSKPLHLNEAINSDETDEWTSQSDSSRERPKKLSECGVCANHVSFGKHRQGASHVVYSQKRREFHHRYTLLSPSIHRLCLTSCMLSCFGTKEKKRLAKLCWCWKVFLVSMPKRSRCWVFAMFLQFREGLRKESKSEARQLWKVIDGEWSQCSNRPHRNKLSGWTVFFLFFGYAALFLDCCASLHETSHTSKCFQGLLSLFFQKVIQQIVALLRRNGIWCWVMDIESVQAERFVSCCGISREWTFAGSSVIHTRGDVKCEWKNVFELWAMKNSSRWN